MKIEHIGDPRSKRRQAYPEIEDQLDAIWKVLATLPPSALTGEAAAMLDQIQAIKRKYPVRKPT